MKSLTDSRRWFAGGVLLIAGLAVALSIVSCSKEPAEEEDISELVLARVAGKDFTVADLDKKLKYQFRSQIEGLSGTEAASQHRQIIDDAVNELCWVELGEKKGYTNNEAFVDTWELSRRYILARETIEHEVKAHSEPTDEEIRAYFEEHASQFQVPTRVQLAHVLLETKSEADRIRTKLLNGEPIEELAKKYSIDERTKDSGGTLAWVTPTSGAGHFGRVPGINTAAMKLMKGDVSEPVELSRNRGWSVLYALDRTEEGPRPFDDTLRETIRNKVRTIKHNQIFGDLLSQMKTEYGVEIYEENFQRYAASLLTEEELFTLAQQAKTPERKIGYYGSILGEYPESRYAPQAQFMIGFIRADELKQYDRAREELQIFIQDHPDHELVESARWMLENMEKPDTDPDVIKEVRRQASTRPS